MRTAKVHVSVMGDDAKQNLSLHGLRSSAGYLQSKIAERIDTRYTPRLQFELDMGVKQSLAISQMLSEVLPADDTDNDVADVDADEIASAPPPPTPD
jgi:ribosome-binding factor A